MKTPHTATTAGAATLALTAALSAICAAAPAATQKPNIIFILCDDLGYGDVGCFWQNARRDSGNPALASLATPQLDRMAAEGARLTQHYCPAPVSAPSRASFLSGLSQGHANVRDNQFDKALADNHTVATVLRQAGYATAAIGKWGLHGADETKSPDGKTVSMIATSDWPAFPLNRGFDFYFGFLRHVDGHEHYPKEQIYFHEKAKARGPLAIWENRDNITDSLDKCYTADLFTARAKQWIIDHEKTDSQKPFFLYLAYDTPHAVLELPTQAYPAGGGLRGGIQWLGTPGHMINTASGTPDTWVHPDFARATVMRDGKPTPWPEVYQRQATSVRRIDDAVGDLLQLLKDLNIDDNTIVVFTSDNGPEAMSMLPGEKDFTPRFFGSFGPFDGIKRDTWEGGLRVPAIVRWPGRVPAGGEDAVPSASFDWLPTFAALAGVPAPANADGVSLLPGLTGTQTAAPAAAPAREYLYFEYAMKGKTPDYPEFDKAKRGRVRGQMQAIRLGDLMAVRYDIKSPRDDFEIYNMLRDPRETENLALRPEGAAMQERLKAIALQARRPEPETPRPYDNALMPAVALAGAGAEAGALGDVLPGLAWKSYEGDFPWVPDCAGMRPVREGVAAKGVDISGIVGGASAGKKVAVVFTGFVRAPVDGDYTFSYGGARAVMRLHEATVIDDDFGNKPGEVKTAVVRLQAGWHPVTLTCLVDGKNMPMLKTEPAMVFAHASEYVIRGGKEP